MKKRPYFTRFATQNSLHQSITAIVLLSGIPLLTILYMNAMSWFQPDQLSPTTLIGVFSSTTILIVAGFVMLLRFPRNLMQLRQYIANISPDNLPATIHLSAANNSDDLRCIEQDLNIALQKMRKQIELAEQNQRKEYWLREKIEQQQRALVDAERHRAMIQSLGAACHHIGQPVTSLQMRLYLMKRSDLSQAERKHIEECENDLDKILDVLDRLRTVSQFRTEPYIADEDNAGSEILAI